MIVVSVEETSRNGYTNGYLEKWRFRAIFFCDDYLVSHFSCFYLFWRSVLVPIAGLESLSATVSDVIWTFWHHQRLLVYYGADDDIIPILA